MQDEPEVTQADYDVANRANVLWGRAINGPHVAVLSAAIARQLGFEQGAKAMRETLVKAFALVDTSPELNMSNYDHDQVDELNKAMIEIHDLLKTTLDWETNDA